MQTKDAGMIQSSNTDSGVAPPTLFCQSYLFCFYKTTTKKNCFHLHRRVLRTIVRMAFFVIYKLFICTKPFTSRQMGEVAQIGSKDINDTVTRNRTTDDYRMWYHCIKGEFSLLLCSSSTIQLSGLGYPVPVCSLNVCTLKM